MALRARCTTTRSPTRGDRAVTHALTDAIEHARPAWTSSCWARQAPRQPGRGDPLRHHDAGACRPGAELLSPSSPCRATCGWRSPATASRSSTPPTPTGDAELTDPDGGEADRRRTSTTTSRSTSRPSATDRRARRRLYRRRQRYYNDDPECELINISPGYQLLEGARRPRLRALPARPNRTSGGWTGSSASSPPFGSRPWAGTSPSKLPGVVSAVLRQHRHHPRHQRDHCKLAYLGRDGWTAAASGR